MNSIAQHAVPNGIGQIEDLRPHFTTASRVVVMTLPPAWTPGYVGSTNLPLKRSSRPMTGPILSRLSGVSGPLVEPQTENGANDTPSRVGPSPERQRAPAGVGGGAGFLGTRFSTRETANSRSHFFKGTVAVPMGGPTGSPSLTVA